MRLERPKVRTVRAASASSAARLAQGLGNDRVSLFDVHHHDAATLVKGLSDFGDAEAARGALDQPDAEAHLQGCYAAAQSRLRRPQRPSRRGKAAMGHDLGKQGVIVKVRRRHRLILGTLRLSIPVYRTLRSMNISFLTRRAIRRSDQGDRR
jgi:hypothetical protein